LTVRNHARTLASLPADHCFVEKHRHRAIVDHDRGADQNVGGGLTSPRGGRPSDGRAIEQAFLFRSLDDVLIATTETAPALFIIEQATEI